MTAELSLFVVWFGDFFGRFYKRPKMPLFLLGDNPHLAMELWIFQLVYRRMTGFAKQTVVTRW